MLWLIGFSRALISTFLGCLGRYVQELWMFTFFAMETGVIIFTQGVIIAGLPHHMIGKVVAPWWKEDGNN